MRFQQNKCTKNSEETEKIKKWWNVIAANGLWETSDTTTIIYYLRRNTVTWPEEYSKIKTRQKYTYIINGKYVKSKTGSVIDGCTICVRGLHRVRCNHTRITCTIYLYTRKNHLPVGKVDRCCLSVGLHVHEIVWCSGLCVRKEWTRPGNRPKFGFNIFENKLVDNA